VNIHPIVIASRWLINLHTKTFIKNISKILKIVWQAVVGIVREDA